jgi:hypothetical protein
MKKPAGLLIALIPHQIFYPQDQHNKNTLAAI